MAADSNRYVNTPRRVFDKHVDAMERKRLRDREDHRNDLKAIFQRLQNLEKQLTLDREHLDDHCIQLIAAGILKHAHPNEGLE